MRRDVESESDANRAAPIELVERPMNTLWILASVAILGVVAALVLSWQRYHRDQDLGAVSDQWIAEHRLGRINDSRQ